MIKAEWTNKDSLDLQPTCNQLATTEGDLISRADAIEAVHESCNRNQSNCNEVGKMTREEALDILHHNWTRIDNPNYKEEELDEAFFMAIEALTYQDLSKPNNTCEVDLISRADAIEAVLTYFIPRSHTGERGEHEEDFVRTIFKSLPSADAVQGEWLDAKNAGWECTVCGKWSNGQYDYCPNCGKRMKGGDTE